MPPVATWVTHWLPAPAVHHTCHGKVVTCGWWYPRLADSGSCLAVHSSGGGSEPSDSRPHVLPCSLAPGHALGGRAGQSRPPVVTLSSHAPLLLTTAHIGVIRSAITPRGLCRSTCHCFQPDDPQRSGFRRRRLRVAGCLSPGMGSAHGAPFVSGEAIPVGCATAAVVILLMALHLGLTPSGRM